MRSVRFERCKLDNEGWLTDRNGSPVMLELRSGEDGFSVTVDLYVGSWSSGRLDVEYANEPTGPWVDFSTAVHLDSATQTSGLLAHVGRYVRVKVHTTISGGFANLTFHAMSISRGLSGTSAPAGS